MLVAENNLVPLHSVNLQPVGRAGCVFLTNLLTEQITLHCFDSHLSQQAQNGKTLVYVNKETRWKWSVKIVKSSLLLLLLLSFMTGNRLNIPFGQQGPQIPILTESLFLTSSLWVASHHSLRTNYYPPSGQVTLYLKRFVYFIFSIYWKIFFFPQSMQSKKMPYFRSG